MAICFFNQNYDEDYRCKYCMKDDDIVRVEIEYDIGKEIEKNGVRVISVNTIYKDRDILVVDSENHRYLLLKSAYYVGSSSKYGTYDDGECVSFESSTYMEADSADSLMKLPPRPKVNRIRIYSSDVATYLRHPSVNLLTSDNEISIIVSRENYEKVVELNKNNIRRIVISDDCSCTYNSRDFHVHVDGFIGIDLRKRVGYEDVFGFVYEIVIFMQLYHPGKFLIDKVVVEVDGILYRYSTSFRTPKYNERPVEYSCEMDLSDFLYRCYNSIPYRNGKSEIRNIPYIVMKSYRGIEDNFLMYYRFIECFYKKQNIKNAFMMRCITDHCLSLKKKEMECWENDALEIVNLRNHYVHTGYYIKNGCLKIYLKGEKKPKYTINVDYNYIYEKTKMLYLMVIDIIFKDMLGIDNYKYKKLM